MSIIGQKLLAPYYYHHFNYLLIGQCINKCFCSMCKSKYTKAGYTIIQVIGKRVGINFEDDGQKFLVKIPKFQSKSKHTPHTLGSNKIISSDFLQFDICVMNLSYLKTLEVIS